MKSYFFTKGVALPANKSVIFSLSEFIFIESFKSSFVENCDDKIKSFISLLETMISVLKFVK